MKKYTIATIPGDGIGPDVVRAAVAALEAAALRFGFELAFVEAPMGGIAIDEFGEPLPASSLETCLASDAVLLGAVGGPKWDDLPGSKRPEAGLLAIRAGLGVFANLRPAIMFPQLAGACPLKPSLVEGGLDILVVRELTGGIYFGERGRSPDGLSAWDTERYSRFEIERLLKVGFDAAAGRKKRLCVVDKANILESSRLWRETATAMSPRWPGVELSFMYVDNAAMQLVKAPRQFDVIATSNMFGDILSDEASMVTGSIGMLASASIGGAREIDAEAVGFGDAKPRGLGEGPGLYEPIHGSAPDIAGKDVANPLAAVLSAALLLRHSLKLEKAARAIEDAVSAVLDSGHRCADIASDRAGEKVIGTIAMGAEVVEAIREAGR
ncbi:MAG: 3-isopropylmalate dehydrogenase [Rectinemataceae bacterium]|jgi:3-isopropylmalate dehydrogenase